MSDATGGDGSGNSGAGAGESTAQPSQAKPKAMWRTNWDAFEDSDDEELEGGTLERATYRVLAERINIYEAPDESTHKLGWRNAGERLLCDARSGNWVRLTETFKLGKGFEKRGWVIIEAEGNAKVGRFLQKL